MDPIHLDGSSPSAPYDQIEIDDDEEDQLASDTDEQPQPVRAPDGEDLEPDPDDEEAREGGGHAPNTTTTHTTNGKRKHPRKTGTRVPGHTLLPATRLENILRADGESGPMSKEAQFALSIATEEFIKRFVRAGHLLASGERRSIVSYRDMAAAAQNPPLKFLEDVVPLPMPLSVALESRTLKEKERIDEDPALSTRPIPSPLPKSTPLAPSGPSHPASSATTPNTTTTAATDSPGPASSSNPSRAKAKSNTTSNGRASGTRSKDKNKESANGNQQTSTPPAPVPAEPERKSRSRRSSRRSEPQGRVEPVVTEHQLSQSHLHPGGAQQPQWQEPQSGPPRNAHTNPQPWLAGPASGFLDERAHVPEAPFGATGRTIYSQR